MSNKRLIDGTALMNRINITATRHRNDGASLSASILTLIHDEIESGVFDIPSNQRLIDSKALLEWIEKSPDADGFWDGTNVTRSVKAFDNLEDAINSGRFDVSNQRLIDGMSDTISKQALLEKVDTLRVPSGIAAKTTAKIIREAIASAPSNKGEAARQVLEVKDDTIRFLDGQLQRVRGEAARLREALEKIQILRISGLGLSIASCFKEAVRIADEALSSHTEDTGIQKAQGIEWIKFVPQVAAEQIEENDYLILVNGHIHQATHDAMGGFFHRETTEGQVVYPYSLVSHYADFNVPGITDGGEQDA